jgi:ComF family protein
VLLSWPLEAGSRLLALLFPADCAVCGTPLPTISRVPICNECLAPVEPYSPEYCCARCRTPFLNAFPLDEHGLCALCRLDLTEFEWSWSYGLHEERLRTLIHLFKYRGMRPLARVLGEWLTRAYPRTERFDALVPMPLHWWKYLRRGFNQSELLAREVSRRTGVPLLACVRRRRSTRAQAGLTRAQRRDNVRGAFRVPRPATVRGLSLLLIDDVQTTGSTVNACARALKRAGAARVCVLTLARAGGAQDSRLGGLASSTQAEKGVTV